MNHIPSPAQIPPQKSSHTFDEILAALRSAKSILVASHLRPDADALGSSLAAALWLRSLQIPTTVWNEDGLPEKFAYLPQSHLIQKPSPDHADFDLIFLLDTSTPTRLGKTIESLLPKTFSINIDHHSIKEPFATINYIDPSAPATGQILFDLLRHANATITPDIATNLFAAISTDTGSFQYDRTSHHTFDVAAELVRLGVDVPSISRQIYESYPRRRLELLRHVLNNCQFFENDRSVCISLTLADQEKLGLSPDDNEGIIDTVRAVNTVIAAVFFEELPDGLIRVSARSKNPAIDVCEICKKFGGGGHPLAAGARIKGNLLDVQTTFMQALNDEIRKLP
ncbi:MAG: bifunctional oligoribonuclease/PAP phosphatase NrnA [Chthoniobacterales bacterium]|nr:bifunctional oligoribonuclease/PAP phosphatase NrnA [Chthoniobacterales bacterium]